MHECKRCDACHPPGIPRIYLLVSIYSKSNLTLPRVCACNMSLVFQLTKSKVAPKTCQIIVKHSHLLFCIFCPVRALSILSQLFLFVKKSALGLVSKNSCTNPSDGWCLKKLKISRTRQETQKGAAVCNRVLSGGFLVFFVQNIFSVSGSSFGGVDGKAITRAFLIASSTGDHPTSLQRLLFSYF